MMASFHPGTVKYRTISGVLVQNLAFQDAAVLERQMEDIPASRIRHRVELHNCHRILHGFEQVAHAAEVAVTTMQTPDSPKRLPLRQLLHTSDTWMQFVHLPH